MKQPSSITVFYCYTHEDKGFRDKLDMHMATLRRSGVVKTWYDGEIAPGRLWEEEIKVQLNTAHIILLLISPHFMDSDYCYSTEMRRSLERHALNGARVIPIIIRPVDCEDAPFSHIQMLPTEAKPITSWPDPDEAFKDVVKGIRRVLADLTKFISEDADLAQARTTSELLFPEQVIQRQRHHSILLPSFTQEDETLEESQFKYRNIHRAEWSEVPHINKFQGRDKELTILTQWIVDHRCQLVALLGMGGIGKTSLVINLAKKVAEGFEVIYWCSLQNAPPLRKVLQECIKFITNQQVVSLPNDVDSQITLLMEYLQKSRCLLIFDNVESVLLSGSFVGQYREECKEYGTLIRCIGEIVHQSCLLLTGREKPKEIAFIEDKSSPVRVFRLEGLSSIDARNIIENKELYGDDQVWENLINRYSGNPLALKLVSRFIKEVFEGDVSAF